MHLYKDGKLITLKEDFMFKLKVDESKHKRIKERLSLTETSSYEYVLTTNKEFIEEDKLNIVFKESDIQKVNNLLDWIVKGESIYIVGYNQFGEKRVECHYVHYVEVLGEEIYAVLSNTRIRIQLKLYEVEEMLKHKGFIRVSKYAVVNAAKIDYIKPALNSKLSLMMMNGDTVIVNRSYLKAFKTYLEL